MIILLALKNTQLHILNTQKQAIAIYFIEYSKIASNSNMPAILIYRYSERKGKTREKNKERERKREKKTEEGGKSEKKIEKTE